MTIIEKIKVHIVSNMTQCGKYIIINEQMAMIELYKTSPIMIL